MMARSRVSRKSARYGFHEGRAFASRNAARGGRGRRLIC
jgi:hypothetical protein